MQQYAGRGRGALAVLLLSSLIAKSIEFACNPARGSAGWRAPSHSSSPHARRGTGGTGGGGVARVGAPLGHSGGWVPARARDRGGWLLRQAQGDASATGQEAYVQELDEAVSVEQLVDMHLALEDAVRLQDFGRAARLRDEMGAHVCVRACLHTCWFLELAYAYVYVHVDAYVCEDRRVYTWLCRHAYLVHVRGSCMYSTVRWAHGGNGYTETPEWC